MRALSIGIAFVLVVATVAAAAPPPPRVSQPAPPKPPSSTAAASTPQQVTLGTVQLDPARLDFSPLWSGESAHKSVVFTVATAGIVSATAPQPPFAIVEMRVLSGTKTTSGMGAGGQAKSTAQAANSPLAQRTSPPWQVTCAAGNEVQIEVAFAPVFDLFKMTAGEKSATIQLHGPSSYGSWNATLPVAGMFNGIRLVPLMKILDGDRAVKENPNQLTQVPLTIRFVSTGQPFNATVRSCCKNSRYTLQGTKFSAAVPSGGTVDLSMWMDVKGVPCCEVKPSDATIEADYTQGKVQGTLSTTIHWTLVSDPFAWNVVGACQNVTFSGAVTLTSSGVLTITGQQWSWGVEPASAKMELTFSGLSKPAWTGQATALPNAQTVGYSAHIDVGPPSSDPSPVFLNLVRRVPTLDCAK